MATTGNTSKQRKSKGRIKIYTFISAKALDAFDMQFCLYDKTESSESGLTLYYPVNTTATQERIEHIQALARAFNMGFMAGLK